jgi:hypothetical protein
MRGDKIQIECSERFNLLHLSYIFKKNIQIILKHFLMIKISIRVFFFGLRHIHIILF